jgi:hypothetical protein
VEFIIRTVDGRANGLDLGRRLGGPITEHGEQYRCWMTKVVSMIINLVQLARCSQLGSMCCVEMWSIL